MLNIIWCAMMLVSVVCAFFTGRVAQTTAAMLDGAKNAVEFVISIGGIMAMWTGIMAVCEKSGMSRFFAHLLSPLINLLFVTKSKATRHAIAMNMVANILGLSNAATPLGIKAMAQLNEENFSKTDATDDMCMLAVVNSASIQLIPSTLIAIRQAEGAANAADIVLPIWITSLIVFVFGVLAVRLCHCANLAKSKLAFKKMGGNAL